MTNKVQINVRLPKRDIVLLKDAAKAYRAPSLNWFVEEMIRAMLNPALREDFSMRLTTGAHQLTLKELEQAGVKPRKKRPPA